MYTKFIQEQNEIHLELHNKSGKHYYTIEGYVSPPPPPPPHTHTPSSSIINQCAEISNALMRFRISPHKPNFNAF